MVRMPKRGVALFELIRDPGSVQGGPARPQHEPPKPIWIPPSVRQTAPQAGKPEPTNGKRVTKPRVRLATADADEPQAEYTPGPSVSQALGSLFKAWGGKASGLTRIASKAKASTVDGARGLWPQTWKWPWTWQKPVTLSTSHLLLAGAGVMVLVLLIWVGAYTLGSKDGQTKTLQDKALAASVEPVPAHQMPVNGTLVVAEPQHRQEAAPKPSAKTSAKTSRSSAAVPAPAAGAAEIVPGLNYCMAAMRLDQSSAERGAAFLRENGLPSAAVQEVEGDWAGGNNPGSWRVVVLRGITGTEYRNRSPACVSVERELVRLGAIYKNDPEGRYDFGNFAWEKRK